MICNPVLRYFRSTDAEATKAAVAAMTGRRPPWLDLDEATIPERERLSALEHSERVNRAVIEEDVRRGIDCADYLRRYLDAPA
jgi:hypothetical protein